MSETGEHRPDGASIESTPVRELVELLEERGVSVSACDGSARWKSGGHDWFATNAWPVNDPSRSTVVLHVTGMTPEEVVGLYQAAQNPRMRETTTYVPGLDGNVWYDENDVEHVEEDSAYEGCECASCEKCGNVMMGGDFGWFDHWDELRQYVDADGNVHRGYYWEPTFNYCPECGRKVLYEDRGYEVVE